MQEEKPSFDEQLTLCRENLLILKGEEGVSYGTAQFFIKHSAYWDHPSAGLVNAPKHAERITNGQYGFELQFGGNYFLVQSAIERCVASVNQLLGLFEQGQVNAYSYERLTETLKLRVRSSVSNFEGEEYDGCYPVHRDYMMFGTQAINVRDFVGIVTATSQIAKMYTFLR